MSPKRIRDGISKHATAIAVGSSILSLFISGGGWWEARRAADVAERTLAAARPVVEVVGACSFRPLKIGDKPLLEIELANHGQGIATDIRIVCLMHVGVSNA